MLLHSFTDLTLSAFFGLSLTYLWCIYYIFVNNITVPAVLATDVKRKKTIDLNGNIGVIIFSLMCIWFILTNYVYIQNLSIHTIFWDMICVSNNTLNYFYIISSILFIILLASTQLFNQNLSFTTEYLLFIILIVLASSLLLSSTSLFLTIFLLELVALLIFGKFAVSRVLFNQNNITKQTLSNNPQFSYGLFNSLFFQFWANFVSSVFLFFALINVHYLFGTSNFFLVNFFFSLISSNWYIPESFNTFTLTVLTTGFFVKLGLAPYQFFKIETYKGIPLFMIIVYTTVYLIVYVYFFSYLFINQLPMLRDFTGNFLLVFLTFGMFYLVNLLFDTKNFKAFLSYSTLITVVNLFIILLVL